MNKTISDREDLFWAKMAGRDVNISTMTPPVASSMREELMLEVAERIGEGGGGAFFVEFTVEYIEEERVISADKSVSEICEAYNSNKTVIGLLDGGLYTLTMCDLQGEEVAFSTSVCDEYGMLAAALYGSQNDDTDEWEFFEKYVNESLIPFCVHITVEEDADAGTTTISTEETCEQIKEAFNSGRYIYATTHVQYDDENVYVSPTIELLRLTQTDGNNLVVSSFDFETPGGGRSYTLMSAATEHDVFSYTE